MVDAVDLRLAEDLVQLVIEPASGFQVAPEGLLDHDAAPARAVKLVIESDPAHLADDLGYLGRLRGQVVEPVSGSAALRVEGIEPLAEPVVAGVVGEVELLVSDALGQLGPGSLVDRLDARVLLQRRPNFGPKRIVGVGPPGHCHDAELGRQQVRPQQLVDGRHDLAVGQIAGCAEEHEGVRVGHPIDAQTLSQRVQADLGTAAAVNGFRSFAHLAHGAGGRRRCRRPGRAHGAILIEATRPGARPPALAPGRRALRPDQHRGSSAAPAGGGRRVSARRRSPGHR